MWRIFGRGADAGGPGKTFETGAVEVGDAAEAAPSSDWDQGFEFHRVGDLGQLLEEGLALVLGQGAEQGGLQVCGDVAQFGEFFGAGGQQHNAVRALVGLVRFSLHPAIVSHALEERRHGVGVAAHGAGDLALRHAGGIAFAEGAQHGELIRRGAGMADAAAKGLIEPVPGAAQQQRQPPSHHCQHRCKRSLASLGQFRSPHVQGTVEP